MKIYGVDDFVLTSDSRLAYVASGGSLFAMDLQLASVTKTELPYPVRTLNISPDDEVLYLHDEAQNVRLYEPGRTKQRCEVRAVLERAE